MEGPSTYRPASTGGNYAPDNSSRSPVPPHPRSTVGQFFKRIRTRSKSPAAKAVPISSPNAYHTHSHINQNGHSNKRPGQVTSPSKDDSSFDHHQQQGQKQHRNDNAASASSDNSYGSTPRTAPRSASSHNPFGNLIARLSGRRPRRAVGGGDVCKSPVLLDQQNSRVAVSEEDLVSKSLASEIEKGDSPLSQEHRAVKNGNVGSSTTADGAPLSAYYSQESVFDGPSRLPSYVRVSCALSGYRKFAASQMNSPAVARYGTTRSGTSADGSSRPLGRSLVERRLDIFEHSPGDNSMPQRSPLSTSTPSPRLPAVADISSSYANDVQSPDSCEGADHPSFDQSNVTSTPVRDLVSSFNNINLNPISENVSNGGESDEVQLTSGGKRPTRRPPPVPPRSSKTVLSPIASEGRSSSATTGSCMTGPLTSSTQDGSSLLDDVLRAVDDLHSVDQVDQKQSSATEEDGSTEVVIMATGDQEQQQANGSNTTGHYYKEQMQLRRQWLEDSCAAGSADLENESLPEHASDAIRLATGKAGLLLKKKLKQFEELVEKNLNPIPNDPRPATLDDLDGYWALVLIDLQDVRKCFEKVDRLRETGWQPPADEDDVTDSSTSAATNGHHNNSNGVSKSSNSSHSHSHAPEISAAKDEERKNLLAEAKRKAKQKMQQQNGNDDVQIFQ